MAKKATRTAGSAASPATPEKKAEAKPRAYVIEAPDILLVKYATPDDADPVKIAAWARDRAQAEGKDVLIVDTSGRLHVDQFLPARCARGLVGH